MITPFPVIELGHGFGYDLWVQLGGFHGLSDDVGFRVNLGIGSITMSLEMLNPLSSTSIGVLIHHGMGVPKIGLDKTTS